MQSICCCPLFAHGTSICSGIDNTIVSNFCQRRNIFRVMPCICYLVNIHQCMCIFNGRLRIFYMDEFCLCSDDLCELWVWTCGSGKFHEFGVAAKSTWRTAIHACHHRCQHQEFVWQCANDIHGEWRYQRIVGGGIGEHRYFATKVSSIDSPWQS